MAPKNVNKWNPIWIPCQVSWKTHFNDHEYMMWNMDDINNFLNVNYPKFYDVLKGSKISIIKIDLTRYLILYHYGGIYADMDMHVYENFYNDLHKPIALASAVQFDYEIAHNSLMASTEKNVFFLEMAEFALNNYIQHKDIEELFSHIHHKVLNRDSKYEIDKIRALYSHKIMKIAGPIALTEYIRNRSLKDIQILPASIYNNTSIGNHHPAIKVHHHATGFWGEENDMLHRNYIKD